MRLLPAVTFLVLTCAALAAEPLRVGAACVEITPQPGTPMAGYYNFRAVEGVLDPLYAKTLVIEQEGHFAALVVLDLSSTSRPIVVAARQDIQEQCGLPGDRVIIAATHTHSGAQLARGSIMDEITKANSPSGATYMRSLPGLIAQSVAEAKAKLVAATPAIATGKAEGLSFNRRVLRDGSSKAIWQPAKIDPATEHPAGPVDPTVGIVTFQSAGQSAATLLNFAMHPTSVGSGLKVSADYPGVFTKLVSERHGGVSIFANGTCGNINHGDYITGKRRTTQELGKTLADAAEAVWPELKTLSTFAPRVRSEQVTLTRRTFSEADIAKAKDVGARMFTEKLGTVPMAEAVCILETEAKRDAPLVGEVQVVSFSDDLAIVALPGEIFVELGLAIKKASPFKHTLIIELANGSIGYVPNREAYPQGNYEVVSARGEAGTGEKLVEVALRLLGEARTGK